METSSGIAHCAASSLYASCRKLRIFFRRGPESGNVDVSSYVDVEIAGVAAQSVQGLTLPQTHAPQFPDRPVVRPGGKGPAAEEQPLKTRRLFVFCLRAFPAFGSVRSEAPKAPGVQRAKPFNDAL
jgi:hypothetical protein